MDSPIGFDDNPWIHKAQLSRRPRQQQLARCTDNKPALFPSFCLHFLLPFKAALLKNNNNKNARPPLRPRNVIGMQLLHVKSTLVSVTSHEQIQEKQSGRATPLHSEPGSKNEILFGPVPKPHNLNYIMQRDASGKCLVSVTPVPDKMEQRNHHSEGDFRFTSDLCCFFSPQLLYAIVQTDLSALDSTLNRISVCSLYYVSRTDKNPIKQTWT